MAVSRIVLHRLSANGIDYCCKTPTNGNIWVRDTDLWDHTGGAISARRYWVRLRETRSPTTLSLADLSRMVDLPQYKGINGNFLRDMHAAAEAQFVQAGPHRRRRRR